MECSKSTHSFPTKKGSLTSKPLTLTEKYRGFSDIGEITCFRTDLQPQIIREQLQTYRTKNDLCSYISTTAQESNRENPCSFALHTLDQLRTKEWWAVRKSLLGYSYDYAKNSSTFALSLTNEGLKTLNQCCTHITALSNKLLAVLVKDGYHHERIFNSDEYALWALSKIYTLRLLETGYIAYITHINIHEKMPQELINEQFENAKFGLPAPKETNNQNHTFVAIKHQSSDEPIFIVDLWLTKINAANRAAFIGTKEEYTKFLKANYDRIYVKGPKREVTFKTNFTPE